MHLYIYFTAATNIKDMSAQHHDLNCYTKTWPSFVDAAYEPHFVFTNNAIWIWMLGGQQSRYTANICTGPVVSVKNH